MNTLKFRDALRSQTRRWQYNQQNQQVEKESRARRWRIVLHHHSSSCQRQMFRSSSRTTSVCSTVMWNNMLCHQRLETRLSRVQDRHRPLPKTGPPIQHKRCLLAVAASLTMWTCPEPSACSGLHVCTEPDSQNTNQGSENSWTEEPNLLPDVCLTRSHARTHTHTNLVAQHG